MLWSLFVPAKYVLVVGAVAAAGTRDGRAEGAALLSVAGRSGFASIAYGDGAAWFTNYDRGTLTKVSG